MTYRGLICLLLQTVNESEDLWTSGSKSFWNSPENWHIQSELKKYCHDGINKV